MATEFSSNMQTNVDLIKTGSGIFREKRMKIDSAPVGNGRRKSGWINDFGEDVTKSNR
jgi:hypothetical protein